MKTGNTTTYNIFFRPPSDASMEPGHEDREYLAAGPDGLDVLWASMEPGHEDREYTVAWIIAAVMCARLNGARS